MRKYENGDDDIFINNFENIRFDKILKSSDEDDDEKKRKHKILKQNLGRMGNSYLLLGAMENITYRLAQEFGILGEIDPREIQEAEKKILRKKMDLGIEKPEVSDVEAIRFIYNPIWVDPDSIDKRKPIIDLSEPEIPNIRFPMIFIPTRGDLRNPDLIPTIRNIYFISLKGPNIVVYPSFTFFPAIKELATRDKPEGSSANMLSIVFKQGIFTSEVGKKTRMWHETPFMVIRFIYCPQYFIKDPESGERKPQFDASIFYLYAYETEMKEFGEIEYIVSVSENIYKFSDALLECMINLLPQPKETEEVLNQLGWKLPEFNRKILEYDIKNIENFKDDPTQRITGNQGILLRKLHLICDTSRCPYCSKPLSCITNFGKNKFELCPFCGRKLDLRCPMCGGIIAGSEIQCPYCQRLVYSEEHQRYMYEMESKGGRYGKFRVPPRPERVRRPERERRRLKLGRRSL